MEYQNLIVEKTQNVGVIKINRPKALNALNTEVLRELAAAFIQMAEDHEVLCVVLTGEGKAFVAGADIAQMKDMSCEEARRFAEAGHETFRLIERISKPVIAAVNGFALGGGLELAMACDFRIASDKAKLGQPEVTLGVIPGFGGTARLRKSVGEGNAAFYRRDDRLGRSVKDGSGAESGTGG
jgi:enoyl-CoA hydratase